MLEKVRKQLGSASKSIDQTFVRTRQMEGALRNVETVPNGKHTSVVALDRDLFESPNDTDEGLTEEDVSDASENAEV